MDPARLPESVLRPTKRVSELEELTGACAPPVTRSARHRRGDRRAAGLGEPVFDRLDADVAHALMSINAVKAEIGAGTRAVSSEAASIATITPAGFQQPRGRHPRRIRQDVISTDAQAHLQHPGAWRHHRHARQRGRHRDHWAVRSVRGAAGHADRGSHAGDRAWITTCASAQNMDVRSATPDITHRAADCPGRRFPHDFPGAQWQCGLRHRRAPRRRLTAWTGNSG